MARLRDYYFSEVVGLIRKEFGFKNDFQVPRVAKVVLNMGVGQATLDSKLVAQAVDELTWISGQRAVSTVARKSIAGFKLREGVKIGATVTLRKARMYEFLDRLINIALPRVKDFRGLSKRSFDGKGNYSFGIKEQIIFPEVAMRNVDVVRGLGVTIVTTATNDTHAAALLKAFNFPFMP